MAHIGRAVVILFTCSGLSAQEVKSINLTTSRQCVELRHPEPPAADCPTGTSCVGSGYGSAAIGDGAPDRRDPHALGVYLLRVTPSDIDPIKPFEAEFRVLNTGLAPIELPISPNLCELQPTDESATFSYLSLALVVGAEELRLKPLVGFVQLYGLHEDAGSTLLLSPGQWITVRASMMMRSSPPDVATARFQGDFWLRRNTFRPHPGGMSTEVQNLYPNKTPTPSIPVRLIHPAPSSNPN